MFTVRIDVLKAMLVICPKKDVRFYLNGIYVERIAGTLYVVCTDGARMLTYSVEDAGDDFNAIIPREDVEFVVKTKAPKATFERTDAVRWQGCGKIIIPLDGKYPDWRHIMTETTSGEAGNYNLNYLGDFGKAAKCVGVKYPRLLQNGPDKAARVELDPLVGVIMPARI